MKFNEELKKYCREKRADFDLLTREQQKDQMEALKELFLYRMKKGLCNERK